jgi:membrane protein implicated in regulation of membrane protease activity
MIYGLYLFSAVFGVPLVLWFTFAGDTDADFGADLGDVGDVGDLGDLGDVADGGGGDLGGPLESVRGRFRFPIGAVPFGMAGFGVTGIILSALSAGTAATFITALVVGVLAALAYASLLNLVRQTGASSEVNDRELEGRVARVVLAIPGGGRGQIVLNAGGQEMYFSATAHDPEEAALLQKDAQVVIVALEQGVARVAHAELLD